MQIMLKNEKKMTLEIRMKILVRQTKYMDVVHDVENLTPLTVPVIFQEQ